MLKLTQREPKLQELNEKAAALLTPELCQRKEPANTLKEQTLEIGRKWQELREKLQLSLKDVEVKVCMIPNHLGMP